MQVFQQLTFGHRDYLATWFNLTYDHHQYQEDNQKCLQHICHIFHQLCIRLSKNILQFDCYKYYLQNLVDGSCILK